MDCTLITCKTQGLYEWGVGIDSHKLNTWTEFWKNYEGIFWKPRIEYDGICDCVYLVATDGGAMIHPMQFQILINGSIRNCRGQLDELNEAMYKLSQMLGFTYDLHMQGYTANSTTDYVYPKGE